MNIGYKDVLEFWFEELKPEQWWKVDPQVDQQICEKFSEIHSEAIHGELWHWRDSGRGRLAEIIVLDQFSRNLFRGDARSYAYDGMALALAQEAIRLKVNDDLSSPKRAFLYLPFMHSESQKVHQMALELYSEPGLEYNLDFELKHKEIIDEYGRYPHRNLALGRENTPQEEQYLKENPNPF